MSAGGNYVLSDRLSPGLLEALVRWVNDPRSRRRLNAPPRQVSANDLLAHFRAGSASNRHFAGIQHRKTQAWIGLYEVTFNPSHLHASIEAMLDLSSPHVAAALAETLPALAGMLASRGVEKAIAKVPESDDVMLRHFARSDWKKEAHFRLELASQTEPGKRLDLIQFGKMLAAQA